MPTPRKYDEERFLLMNAVADSVVESSDEELLAEARESGEDFRRIVEEVRGTIKGALKRHDQRFLSEARKSYREAVTRSSQRPFDLGMPMKEMRDLLRSVFQQMPEYRGFLTAQCRDYRELPDNEVKSIIEQLHRLGALDKIRYDK